MSDTHLREIFETGCVRDLITSDPAYSSTLEKLGIDTCCGSGQRLAEAARHANVTWQELEEALNQSRLEIPSPVMLNPSWATASTTLLIDYILQLHHAPLQENLPLLDNYFQRALHAHPDHQHELQPLYERFSTLATELLAHLKREEEDLFPVLLHHRSAPQPAHIIGALEDDHTAVGALLKELDQLSNHYHIPTYACSTVQRLFRTLAELDRALHEHIALENNYLFQRR